MKLDYITIRSRLSIWLRLHCRHVFPLISISTYKVHLYVVSLFTFQEKKRKISILINDDKYGQPWYYKPLHHNSPTLFKLGILKVGHWLLPKTEYFQSLMKIGFSELNFRALLLPASFLVAHPHGFTAVSADLSLPPHTPSDSLGLFCV